MPPPRLQDSRPHVCAVRDDDALPRHGRFRALGEGAGYNPQRVEGVPVTRYWLIPAHSRPKLFMPHPTMSSEEIRQRTQGVWDDFYSISEIWKRSRCATN